MFLLFLSQTHVKNCFAPISIFGSSLKSYLARLGFIAKAINQRSKTEDFALK